MALLAALNTPEDTFSLYPTITFCIFLLSLIINILVYVQSHEEHVVLRKISFFLLIVKIVVTHLSIVYHSTLRIVNTGHSTFPTESPDNILVDSLRRFINFISLFETVVFNYYLIIDFYYFGSGIKDYITLKKFKNAINLK